MKHKPKHGWWRRHPWWTLVLSLIVVFAAWVLYLDLRITRTFEARRWDLPARLYAQPLELYVGRAMRADQLEQQLIQLGYRAAARAAIPGQYRRGGSSIALYRRSAEFWDGREDAQRLVIDIAGGKVSSLRDGDGGSIAIARLDPLMIGSIFAAHGEDRIVLAPEAIPPLLSGTLRLVEDRRFDTHFGIDPKAIVRAALANVRAGGIRQGGSTLTQQLVKSYFLTNEQTFRRKIQEAIMSVLLEMRFDKQEILTAYSNEIYLGQDGARAIHGFGLASQFYFAQPLSELDPARIALLVAIVRGPSYYQPVRFAERAKQRRDRILGLMSDTGLITEGERDKALAQPVAVAGRDAERANYHPAFVDVVRRQLARDYSADDLREVGLRIHTTLDPLAQTMAQRHLRNHLDTLASGADTESLQGAVVLVEPRLGEIMALVGSRQRIDNGFNRALDARRQIGSLIKPVVYLAALQTGDWHLASVVDDSPLSMAQEDGRLWEPQNFSKTFEGEMPLLRALSESVNVATVRVGLAIGVRAVADTLHRLGGPASEQPFASLLLGAVEMSPLEVANVYTSLASDGLRPPLRAVREVVSADDDVVHRYPLTIDSVAGSDALYQLNTALRQVMLRGTGRSAVGRLPESLATAGKTGTTNDFRDAWFAGYSNDRLAVVWVGNDDNSPTGLTGSRGALPVWLALMADVASEGVRLRPPSASREVILNYQDGRISAAGCEQAAVVGVPAQAALETGSRCGGARIGQRALQWLRDTF